MIAEIQSTIVEAKDEIRRRYRAEIKGRRVGTRPTPTFFSIPSRNPIIPQILKDLEEEVAHGQNRMA